MAILLPDPFDSLLVNMSLSVHFKPFATGSMYLTDVAYLSERGHAQPVP